jgi:hypothetical protein
MASPPSRDSVRQQPEFPGRPIFGLLLTSNGWAARLSCRDGRAPRSASAGRGGGCLAVRQPRRPGGCPGQAAAARARIRRPRPELRCEAPAAPPASAGWPCAFRARSAEPPDGSLSGGAFCLRRLASARLCAFVFHADQARRAAACAAAGRAGGWPYKREIASSNPATPYRSGSGSSSEHSVGAVCRPSRSSISYRASSLAPQEAPLGIDLDPTEISQVRLAGAVPQESHSSRLPD